MNTIRVLGCDPGLVNSAIFVADITIKDNGKLRIRVIDSFMMKTTLKDVTDEAVEIFEKYCKYLNEKYKPELFCCERFQPRGGFLKASIVELVNQMITIMRMTFRVPTKFVTAGSWKNIFQKKINKVKLIDLKQLYKTHRKIGPHRLDAALLTVAQFGFNPKVTHRFAFYLERHFGGVL